VVLTKRASEVSFATTCCSCDQDVLVKSLETKVSVKKGSITIKFKDLTELESLIEKIR